MPAHSYYHDDIQTEWRSRICAGALSAGFHLAVLGLFLWHPLGAAPPPRPIGARLTVVQLGTDPAAGNPNSRTVAKAVRAEAATSSRSSGATDTDAQANDSKRHDRQRIAISTVSEPAPPPAEAASNAEKAQVKASPEQQVTAQEGVIAMGVRASGTAGAPDAVLAGAISAAIVNQIRACWAQPTGSIPSAPANLDRRLIVATFSQDGELSSAPTLYVVRNDQQSAIAEPDDLEQSAIDALVRCAPIKLPPALYAYWQQIELELFPSPPPPPELAHGS